MLVWLVAFHRYTIVFFFVHVNCHASCADDDAVALRDYCSSIGAATIFNSTEEQDTARLQYSFPALEELPLKVATITQQLTLLRRWLKILFPFNEAARSWTCLESLAGCLQQQVHSDYPFQAISDAVAESGPIVVPYICMWIL